LWGKIDDMTYTYVDIASLKTLYKKNLYKGKTYTKKRVNQIIFREEILPLILANP